MVQAQADTEANKILFALLQEFLGVRQQDLVEADGFAGPELGGNGQVYGDHVRDFWITADGLAIPEQKNRFPIWWHLDGSRSYCLGDEIARVQAFQGRAFQPHRHAV